MSERDIFFALLDLPEADRPAYLDRACADDPALRERVEALLRSHREAGRFLDPPSPEGGATRTHGGP
ncbi:MAG: hypothetical protein K2W96_07880, partial [Gemmataceae bacterium]|nr:hypothetical protein [Gemmataceae bacterium]